MTAISGAEIVSTKQERIAELAKKLSGKQLTSLAHHIDLLWMVEAYRRTRKDGAVGVDGQDAKAFEADLAVNLGELLEAAKSGTYRAPPVRRVYIPKGDGKKTRPIGIPTLSDKVLQRAVVMALEPVYEEEFYDFSYGFRPKRSARDAARALNKQLWKMGGGWVLDADVSSFFDDLDHAALRDILRQRVTDGVLVRLVGKWLNAGVMEGGVVTRQESGTPQGGVISPLLANIYLHEVLDRWWVEEVVPRLSGKAALIRYADDFVIVFQKEADARRVQDVLPKRFGRFGLSLHPEKTRLVPFSRPKGGGRGSSKPGTFDFLGFTHYWGKTRKGKWMVKQKTAASRFSRTIQKIDRWCRRMRHAPVPWQAKMLNAKLRGHYLYYGVPGNSRALSRLLVLVQRAWHKWLSRRSQRAYIRWEIFAANHLRRNPLLKPKGFCQWEGQSAKP